MCNFWGNSPFIALADIVRLLHCLVSDSGLGRKAWAYLIRAVSIDRKSSPSPSNQWSSIRARATKSMFHAESVHITYTYENSPRRHVLRTGGYRHSIQQLEVGSLGPNDYNGKKTPVGSDHYYSLLLGFPFPCRN